MKFFQVLSFGQPGRHESLYWPFLWVNGPCAMQWGISEHVSYSYCTIWDSIQYCMILEERFMLFESFPLEFKLLEGRRYNIARLPVFK